jgi:hypothetical protein
VFAWLQSLPWTPITAVGLVGTWVLMVWRGTLVPKPTFDTIRESWESRLADKGRESDDWKQAFFNSEKARTQTDQQLAHLLELNQSTDLYIRSLPKRNGDPD